MVHRVQAMYKTNVRPQARRRARRVRQVPLVAAMAALRAAAVEWVETMAAAAQAVWERAAILLMEEALSNTLGTTSLRMFLDS